MCSFFLTLYMSRELCAVSKLGGISLPASMIMKAAMICSKKVELLHQYFHAAMKELEEQVVVEREARLEKMRQYRAMQEATESNNAMMEDYEPITTKGGIDRDDPILQWSFLHEPVSLRET
jgi:hypothetical protein